MTIENITINNKNFENVDIETIKEVLREEKEIKTLSIHGTSLFMFINELTKNNLKRSQIL